MVDYSADAAAAAMARARDASRGSNPWDSYRRGRLRRAVRRLAQFLRAVIRRHR